MTARTTEGADARGRSRRRRDPLHCARVGGREADGWIATRGAAAACGALGIDPAIFHQIQRKSAEEHLAYGEIVALSGDYYGSPKQVFEGRPPPTPWLWRDEDLAALGHVFDRELHDPEHPRVLASVEAALRRAWNAKWYAELSLRAPDHHAWHNLVAYCRHHTRALHLARQARGATNERFFEAIVHNAFADHFLMDAFAGGHVRVPRDEIIDWTRRRRWSQRRAAALSKLLHDHEGGGEGLAVRNAHGERARAGCDARLFFAHEASTADVVWAVSAVDASVRELLAAWQTGTIPTATFAASCWVPFSEPDAPGLAERFSERSGGESVEALLASAEWYAGIPWIGPGLRLEHVRALVEDLPDLMARFAASVTAAIAREPELRVRLPAPYVQSYTTLR